MLYEINWSLVSACNANCVFCPRHETVAKKVFMDIELVEKLLKEINDKDFRAKHELSMITVGENGESTLHPQFIEILRLLKTTGLTISLYTNFSKLDNSMANAIISEELVNSIHTNVDGPDPYTYRTIKQLNLETVLDNIQYFLKKRKDKDINFHLHAVTAWNYSSAVIKHFVQWPHKLSDDVVSSIDDGYRIKEQWQPLLRENGDSIAIDDVLMWAERDHTPYRPGAYLCPRIECVQHSAYIAPNGDWYACCFDVKNVLVLGNLYEESIDDIDGGLVKAGLVELLSEGNFQEIGYPCNRVDACQVVNPYS
uniref:Putative radical SAM superfamily protein n=1 Tax=viral metagenome TaxID=1070528 RepID=A0A6M3KZ69_9ZZZZ